METAGIFLDGNFWAKVAHRIVSACHPFSAACSYLFAWSVNHVSTTSQMISTPVLTASKGTLRRGGWLGVNLDVPLPATGAASRDTSRLFFRRFTMRHRRISGPVFTYSPISSGAVNSNA